MTKLVFQYNIFLANILTLNNDDWYYLRLIRQEPVNSFLAGCILELIKNYISILNHPI